MVGKMSFLNWERLSIDEELGFRVCRKRIREIQQIIAV